MLQSKNLVIRPRLGHQDAGDPNQSCMVLLVGL